MEKENVINYIKENIEQIENAKSDYAFSNNAIREVLTEIYSKVSMIEERPKGKWIIDDLDELNRIWKCHCSKCDKNPLDYVSGTENWWIYKKQMPKYCPNCGADMIGTEKEKR